MNVRSFFDTNILVYTDDDSFPLKQKRALELIEEHRRSKTAVVSLQVLQEYFSVAVGKLKLPAERARNKVELASQLHLGVPDVADILAAIDLHRLHSFSFWDALIIQMAQQTGCKVIYSEDLQHTRSLGGLKIVNPFTK